MYVIIFMEQIAPLVLLILFSSTKAHQYDQEGLYGRFVSKKEKSNFCRNKIVNQIWAQNMNPSPWVNNGPNSNVFGFEPYGPF